MSVKEYVEQYADGHDGEIMLADGFDDALLGIGECAGHEPAAVYDFNACVEVLVTRDGMDADEAKEFMHVNVISAYVGPGTPIFLFKGL